MDRVTLSLDQLKSMIGDGSVDTVLVAFPDNQGRLVGKRVMGQYFLDVVAEGSVEACNYLLAVDVEMNPLPGYKTMVTHFHFAFAKELIDSGTLETTPPWIPMFRDLGINIAHIFDFHEGWMYVLGVGIAGGMTLAAGQRNAGGEPAGS